MDREFCIAYISDDCLDCPELSDGKSCITKSNCFKVKEKIIADLRKLERIEQAIKKVNCYYPLDTISEIENILKQDN